MLFRVIPQFVHRIIDETPRRACPVGACTVHKGPDVLFFLHFKLLTNSAFVLPLRPRGVSFALPFDNVVKPKLFPLGRVVRDAAAWHHTRIFVILVGVHTAI